MILVVDDMLPKLSHIVEFINQQMREAEVYTVEIRQQLSLAGRLLSTRVLGCTQNAETKITKTQSAVVLNGADGEASISLSYLVYAPGFASEEKRQELVDRMHSADFEFQMANLNGDIRIPLSALAAQTSRAIPSGSEVDGRRTSERSVRRRLTRYPDDRWGGSVGRAVRAL